MKEIQEYVNIKDYSTIKIGGQFRYFTTISKAEDLPSLCAIAQSDGRYKNTPIFILGGGSNVVFSDGVVNVLAVKMEIKGFEIIFETDEYVDIKVAAGEIWDEFVERTVLMNLSGLEALSSIPGTVGATPVQNVGAYGSEVKDTILEVEFYDIEKGVISNLSNKDCKFGYRDSIFKNELKGKYVIMAVVYRLMKLPIMSLGEENVNSDSSSQKVSQILSSQILSYPGVKKYFEDKNIENPTLQQVRDAIIDIRKEKLPDPKEIPNVGSFFKNPILPKDIADKIKINFPEAKFFPIDDFLTKVPAGWLIEKSGLKGKSFGNISVYDKNALVLVNNGGATKEDLVKVKNEIINIVKDKFGVVLDQEPEMI